MDIKTLESFRLSDAVKFHDKLNTKLFANTTMRPDVRKQLLLIAKDFLDEMGIEDLNVKDITLSGSNAAYTYTDHSDLDLHILVDMEKLPKDEVYQELFDAKKVVYNDAYDIKIHNIPVELYVQDSNEPVISLGEYSVKNNKWIRQPTKQRAELKHTTAKLKYNTMIKQVHAVLKSRDIDKVKQLIKKIKQYRQAGLDKGGELSPENLVYKNLRTQGYITKLYDLRDKLHGESLTIETMYATESTKKDTQKAISNWSSPFKQSNITLNQLYHGSTPLDDEAIWMYVSPSDFNLEFTVRTIRPLELEELLLSRYGNFYNIDDIQELYACIPTEQQQIVDSYKKDPNLSNEIIVLSDYRRIVDGNHRALAAVLTNKPIKYIDLCEEHTELNEASGQGYITKLYALRDKLHSARLSMGRQYSIQESTNNNLPPVVYHVTPKKNLRSIMKHGLRIGIGARSMQIPGERAAIFCFPSVMEAEDAVMNWLGDEFDDDTDLSLLAIQTKGLPGECTPNAEYEIAITSDIPVSNISVANELFECSGYIPSKKEKNDPRWKTALTVDIKPDTMKQNAKKLGSTISRAGIPPLLRP